VSGLAGAASYTLATQEQSLPPALDARWNAQIAGTLVAGLAILVGIVVQVAAGTRRRQEHP
jgi:hypothetical protein